MWEKVSGATLDWSEANAATRMKAPPPFGFGYLENVLVMRATDASHAQWELEGITQGLQDLASNWNKITNTSGIFPVPALPATNLLVDYVYPRNMGSRPWLDELCRMRRTMIELFSDPFTTAPALDTKAETAEFQKPPIVASLRQQEIEWLSSNARKLGRYEGKWIALEGDKIVASGSDEVAVEMRARMKGIKIPFLIRVPSKEDMLFIGYSLYDSNGIR